MALPDKFKLSNEAIAYQGKSALFKELTLAFDDIIEQRNTNVKALNDLNLGKIIQHHTGLNVTVKFGDFINAYAIPPVIDAHSPMVQRWRNVYGHDLVADFAHEQGYHKKIADKVGTIDLRRSRVTGVFSELKLDMVIGTGLWRWMKLTGAQVAAIVLHETGHLFTFLEFVTRTVTVNAAITSAVQALNGESNQEERVKIVYATARMVNAHLESPEALAQPKVSGTEFATVLLRAIATERPLMSAAGSGAYDTSGSEFVADQFAARHGAGVELAVALDRMMRSQFEYRTPRSLLFVIEALRVGFGIVFTIAAAANGLLLWPILFALFTAVAMWDPNAESREYDLPADRLSRIRRDLIQALKSPKLPAIEHKQITDEIAQLDHLLVGVNAHRSLVNLLWISLTAKRRNQFTQMRFQQELESIINNDLFVKASQLKTLT